MKVSLNHSQRARVSVDTCTAAQHLDWVQNNGTRVCFSPPVESYWAGGGRRGREGGSS